MFRVALIGDVHANLTALEAVLAHVRRQGVEGIWNVGDFVGYGAFPDEVVKRLWREQALSIIGNYDLKVLKFMQKKNRWRKTKHPLKYLAFQWAFEHLSRESRQYLRALPREIRAQVEGRCFLLTHGSPISNEEPLTPSTSDVRLRELAQEARADVIICGHSHQPFARQLDDVWFINAGSVGRPDDGDPRACYAVLEIGLGDLCVCHHRLEYDVHGAVEAIRTSDLPEAFAQMLLQGRSLDVVLGE